MRILHVIIGLGMGGAERSLLRLLRAHAGNAHYEHHVVTLTQGGALEREVGKSARSLTQFGLVGLSSLPGVFAGLVRKIRELRPDVVHCWMYHSDFLGGIAARMCGVGKIVWSIRNTHLEGGGRVKRLLRKACALLSRWIPTDIVCVAHSARLVHQQVGYMQQKMLVIPNGYDPEEWRFSGIARDALRRELGYAQDDIVIGSIGRFSPAKDHENFVRAASLAARQNGRLKFLLVGRGIDTDPDFLRLAESVLPRDRIILLGQRDDVAECLSAIDVFCLHSNTEGFPNVLAEAMAVGRACVATDVGDSRIMLDGLAPVVPPRDPGALADALLAVADLADHEREAIGHELRRRVVSQYSMEAVIAQYERLYSGSSGRVASRRLGS